MRTKNSMEIKDLIEEAYAQGYGDAKYGFEFEFPKPPDAQKVSDGYHTFEQLYHCRTLLWAAFLNQKPDFAWKSKLHSDGTMFEDYFIAGIKTPEGNYSFHQPLEYWQDFKIGELERAPEFDGHQWFDIDRIFSV